MQASDRTSRKIDKKINKCKISTEKTCRIDKKLNKICEIPMYDMDF